MTLSILDAKSKNIIASSQVITSLDSVVKELIENAIDAKATSITITFHSTPISVQVEDNGRGIPHEDLPDLAKGYRTSKLTDTSELSHLSSFGFRGEALHSIAVTARLEITSRCASDLMGIHVIYDSNGNMESSQSVQRPLGTLVRVSDFFSAFPVREGFLKRHYAKEMAKAVQTIQMYCLGTRNVRFLVHSYRSESETRNVLLSSPGKSLKESIVSVLGAKQMKSLVQVSTALGNDDWMINGYISSPNAFVGRSSADRQFLFLNSRPFDSFKIRKTINSVFKELRMNQSSRFPVFVFFIECSLDMVDVNVTPDKRILFMAEEDTLIGLLRNFLEDLFTPDSQEFAVSPLKVNCSPSPVAAVGNLLRDANVKLIECHQKNEESPKTIPRKRTVSVSEHIPMEMSPSQQLIDTFMVPMKSPIGKHISSPMQMEPNTSASHHIPEQTQVSPIPVQSVPEEPAHTVERRKLKIITDNFESFYFSSLNSLVQFDRSSDVTNDPVYTTESSIADIHGVPNALGGDSLRLHSQDESDLRKTLQKSSFRQMDVLGQFNLGFIIAKHGSDLYIIDQHAADEKKRFENFIKTTTIGTQHLSFPMKLDLNASMRLIVSSNRSLFEQNGFQIVERDDSVYLTTCPSFTKYEFRPEDFYEMVAAIDSGTLTHSLCIPRARSIFASRACRSAFKIGDALNIPLMRRIVTQLSALERPWNCPHGRPTVRHLVDLSTIKYS